MFTSVIRLSVSLFLAAQTGLAVRFLDQKEATPAPSTPVAAPVFDGEWEGATSGGQELSFTVKDNRVVSVFAEILCGNVSGSTGTYPKGGLSSISDGKFQFSLNVPYAEGSLLLLIVGSFASELEASGTAEISPHGSCPGVKDTWTAKNTTHATPATPTAAPPTPAAVSYDGTWGGSTKAGGKFLFRVANNTVTYVDVTWHCPDGSNHGVDYTWGDRGPSISRQDGTFAGTYPGGDMTIRGQFSSATAATGTILINNPSFGCRLDTEWTANA